MAIKKVVCFGIGSNSFGNLNTVSFGVLTDRGWILIDCGPDIPRQVKKAGIGFDEIVTVILTHSHMDHCLGLPYLLFGRNLALMPKAKANEKISAIQIVSEKWLWTRLWELFRALHPNVSSLVYKCKHLALDIKDHVDIAVGAAHLQSVQTLHSVRSYGIKIVDSEGVSFAYSGDSRPSHAFEDLATHATCVVLEGMVPEEASGFAKTTKHSTATEAGEAASRIGCPNTYMAHLRPQYLERKADLEREASDIAGFHVRYPVEGETILSI
ncbi:MAG: MBL fold metallo-hydrolase [Desulfobacteraceae bacterium]|nr:MBL fold metallo-hydrolase [Desulfobacteraceae bacterium]